MSEIQYPELDLFLLGFVAACSLLGAFFFFLGKFIFPKPFELNLIFTALAVTTIIYAALLYSRLKREAGRK